MSRSVNSQDDAEKRKEFGDQLGLLSRMTLQGRSWSGRERNCCFLNTGTSRFANISAVSGLDFADDGRAVAPVDWDHDGDIDLWMSNRNTPRLRLMRNDAPSKGHFVSFRLQGNGTTTSRDAIGARVEVRLPGSHPPLIKTLHAGEGFIAQGSKWLHFGLGGAKTVDKVRVQWPSGQAQEFTGIEIDKRYLLVQEESDPKAWYRQSEPRAVRPSTVPQTGVARIPLIVLLPFPKMRYSTFDHKPAILKNSGGKPLLINLWTSSCAPCLAELKEFTNRERDLRGRGLEIVALSVDGLGDDRSDPAAAEALLRKLGFPFLAGRATTNLLDQLQYMHDVLMPMWRPLPVPTSFLVDGQGRLQVIYKGRVEVDTLLSDLGHSNRARPERFAQSSPLHGLTIDHKMIERSASIAEAQIRFRFANFLRAAERLDESVRQYRDLIQVMPDFTEAHNNFGLTLVTLGELKEAEDQFQAAIRINPNYPDAHNNLGRIYLRQKQLAEARSAFEEAVRLKPDYVHAHYNLGWIHLQQKQMAEARSAFEEALRLKPDFVHAHYNLGWIHLQQKQMAEARNDFEEAIRLKPDFVDAHFNLGITLENLGDLDAARAHFQEALRLDPNNSNVRNNLERVQKLLEQ